MINIWQIIGESGVSLVSCFSCATGTKKSENTFMLTFIFNLCIFLILPLFADADNAITHDRLIRYGIHDGLANNIVFDIKQDKDGYIWFATEEGLSKFNGVDFVNYKWTSTLASEVTNYTALRIFCDDSRVYVGTHFGLYIYDTEMDDFRLYKNESNGPNKHNNQIRAIIKRREGGFWIGVYGGGVFSFDPKTGIFNRLNYEYGDDRILSLYEDNKGNLFVGTHFGGLDVVDTRHYTVKHFKTTNGRISDDQIETIFEDSYRNLWVGTWNGLSKFDKERQNLTLVDIPKLRDAKVNSITEDRSGNLWVGTEYFLSSFNIQDFQVDRQNVHIKYYSESESGFGLSYKTIRSVLADKDNNIWIGTYSGGVNFINQFKQKFNYISSEPLQPNSISYKRISSFSEDNKGNLWIATDGGGVNYWDIQNQIFTRITARDRQYNLSDDAVLCALVDSDNDVWFGTYNCVLNRKKNGTNQFIQYRHREGDPHSIVHSDLSVLYEDSQKRIWVGQRTGLSYFDKATNRFTIIEPLKWLHVTKILEYKGDLIVGTLTGLYRYNYRTGEVSSVSKKMDNALINTFLLDKRGTFWIGTNGQGLWEYDIKHDWVSVYDEENGLESNVVLALMETSDGVWVSTNNSISKIQPGTKQIETYNSADGVQPGMFLRNSGLKLKSGLIAFGGTEGMNIFNPALIRKDTHPTKVVFTDFALFNQPVNVRTDENPDSPLIRDINSVNEIRLKYHESVFTIDYLGINYSSPERIEYAYILEDADKKWNFVNNKRSVTYRNLSPGTYYFKIMASSPAGEFDKENMRTLKIIIEPPFWMTWWAYLIYAGLMVLAAYLVWNVVTMRVRALNKIKYERLEREKSEELYQAKLQFFTNISHELRTPLTLIIAPIDKLLRGEKKEENIYLLSLVKKNALRVINNVNEIIDIRKIDHGQLRLQVTQIDIVAFLKEIASSFEDVANNKNINLIFSSIDNSLAGWISTGFVDKIVYNILSNAFKFTPEYGEIIINVSVVPLGNHEGVSIEISDTGIGISEENIEKIFDRFHQVKPENGGMVSQGSGIGLHLVKSLVALHKGLITVQSKINRGSKFTVVIPIDMSAYARNEIMMGKVATPATTHKTEVNEALLENTASTPQPENRSESAGPDKKYKLLVVEDESDIRDFVSLELGGEYEIIQAENGKTGLEYALKHIPDLIVSDIMMPEMNGLELCRMVKEDINTCHIPVILLTAKDGHEDRLQGLEVGADSYIPKPFDVRHLQIRVKQLIKSREAVKEKFLKKIEIFTKEDKEANNAPQRSHDDLLLRKIVSYITDNISDPDINGESIGEYVAMSRMSLHRKLKALVGLSAGDLIRDIRLEYACKKLKETDRTITEISYDSGFSSSSYFYTCFTKKYGMSPSEFLKQNRGEG